MIYSIKLLIIMTNQLNVSLALKLNLIINTYIYIYIYIYASDTSSISRFQRVEVLLSYCCRTNEEWEDF